MRSLLTAALLFLVVAVQAQTPVIQDPPTWTQAGINYVGDDGSCVQGSQFCGPGTVWDPELLQCVGTVTENPCPADLDMDGVVGTSDLLEILGMFGTYCE